MTRLTMSKKLFIPPKEPRLFVDEVKEIIELIKKIDIGTLTQRQYMEEIDKLYKQKMENRND